ncbi:hypothetical protein QE152_g25707 [Popillia japonica]|uniref:Uncharacterized protein n=1 Tax=Popillia japonica TaxID=7064 RepID=A0AAW1K027_POPJA
MSRPSKIIRLVTDIKPTRMWIDGKSFYITNDPKNYTYDSHIHIEEYKAHFNIDFSNDLYRSRFHLPSIYYENLHNFSHFTIKELEEHTNTNISVPQISNAPIVISSECIKNVIDARHKLHSVFSVIRERQNVLQFISIPVTTDDVKMKFEAFKIMI